MGSSFAESRLENDAHILLSADPKVKSFAVQPHQLVYWAPNPHGEMTKSVYTPDLVVLGADQLIRIIEVKAAYFAEQDRWKRIEPYIREAYALDHGVSFHLFTEHEIRQQPRLSNAQIMVSHRPPPADDQAAIVLRHLLDDLIQTTIGALCERAAALNIDGRRAFSAVMRLGLSGEARLDLSRPISGATPLSRAR